uniref:Uncharacterized protein n=1 Tax=viral metagenome TaxID=1070528 RepID=A0A6M3J6N5_9ZZZZ
MAKFSFYSTDIDPTNDPVNASPSPSILVTLNRDPLTGTYDPQAGDSHRGSVIPTLGGVIIQEYTANIKDQRIKISDTDALTQENINTLRTVAASGEWYFTDGYDIWKVQFSKPRGFVYRRNILIAHSGKTIYDYEIELVPIWKSGEA